MHYYNKDCALHWMLTRVDLSHCVYISNNNMDYIHNVKDRHATIIPVQSTTLLNL